MNGRWTRAAAWIAVLMAGGFTAGTGQNADEVLERVRERYENIRDAQLSFSRRSSFGPGRVEQTESGTLLLKKQDRYRVELGHQTIVTDGETVWSYSRQAHQVLIDRFRKDPGGLSPERVLMGAPADYSASLIGRDTVAGRGTIGLKLIPRDETAAPQVLRLWVDPHTWLIRRARLEDGPGRETVYTVAEIRINTGIPDARFVFDVPEGAEVVDLR